VIHKQGAIPVEYTVDQVFTEATQSKHIPRHLGILKLHCRDEALRRNSVLQARIGFMLFKFGMDARVADYEQNQFLYIAGSSRDAELELSFDFMPNEDNSTNVAYNFELELKSKIARSAEASFGGDRTQELIGGVVLGIIDNVQYGLRQTYGSSLQRPA
jgi:hypothetical protein